MDGSSFHCHLYFSSVSSLIQKWFTGPKWLHLQITQTMDDLQDAAWEADT